MAPPNEDVSESSSVNSRKNVEYSDKVCNHCSKKVIDFVQCIKCFEYFHPSCMTQSAAKKFTICTHETSKNNESKISKVVSCECLDENRLLKIEIKYLNQIIMEMQSKNSILLENNKLVLENNVLLKEKILNLEECIKSNCKQSVIPLYKTSVALKVDEPDKTSKNTNLRRMTSTVDNNEFTNKEHRDGDLCCLSRTKEQPSNLAIDTENIPKLATSKVSKIKMLEKECSTSNEGMQNKQEDWSVVTSKKNKNSNRKKVQLVCTGLEAKSADLSIQGAVRRKWLYIGKVAGNGVAEEDILNYLKESLGNHSFVVKKLTTKGYNSAFSVGIPNKTLFEKVFDISFWSEGIVLREFEFKNFFRKVKIDQKKT
ncbi:hypothetical protein WA026_017731 [Henosepilachna vigintioctopunctata]|uniref:Uncharacterized protein n=1 Tax=Henosepilachna vigintioctopunctata TaxID=420089 RepID=A0AAW1UAP2_9CUCU